MVPPPPQCSPSVCDCGFLEKSRGSIFSSHPTAAADPSKQLILTGRESSPLPVSAVCSSAQLPQLESSVFWPAQFGRVHCGNLNSLLPRSAWEGGFLHCLPSVCTGFPWLQVSGEASLGRRLFKLPSLCLPGSPTAWAICSWGAGAGDN